MGVRLLLFQWTIFQEKFRRKLGYVSDFGATCTRVNTAFPASQKKTFSMLMLGLVYSSGVGFSFHNFWRRHCGGLLGGDVFFHNLLGFQTSGLISLQPLAHGKTVVLCTPDSVVSLLRRAKHFKVNQTLYSFPTETTRRAA